MQLSQRFINLKQTLIRGVALRKEDKLPKVVPFITNEHLEPADTTFKPGPMPIFVDKPLDITSLACSGAHAAFNVSTSSLSPSSPASSYGPSLFLHNNPSTCTTLTVPSPTLSPISCLPPTKGGSDSDLDEPENGIPEEDSEDDEFLYETGGGMFGAKVSEISCPSSDSFFSEVDPKTKGYLAPPPPESSIRTAVTRKEEAARKKAARRSIFWDGVDVRLSLSSLKSSPF